MVVKTYGVRRLSDSELGQHPTSEEHREDLQFLTVWKVRGRGFRSFHNKQVTLGEGTEEVIGTYMVCRTTGFRHDFKLCLDFGFYRYQNSTETVA